jgi:PHD/YefM family antitoxin component YafN of YafNO toxin-antitoxin module
VIEDTTTAEFNRELTDIRNLRNMRKMEVIMIEVQASEFAKNFGRYKELAQREPVAVTSHGRTSGYFISEQEYLEYRRLKAHARRAYHISELPQETIAALKTAQMDPAHDHLNALMDD